MTNDNNKENEILNNFLKLSRPSEEDFKRVFTDDELKELCLKQPCRVDIWRWNVVNDYRILFTGSGRYQKWSDRKRLLMLAKAVNKMKPSVLYDEEEIKNTRKEEWGLQLKENILSLNYWKRKRLRALEEGYETDLHLNVSDTEEVLSQYAVNTESMNVDELCTQSQTQQSLEQLNQVVTATTTTAKATTLTSSSESDEDAFCLTMHDEYIIEGVSDDSMETVLPKQLPQEKTTEYNAVQPLETLQSEEVALEIQNIYDLNTMSMTIDTQLSTQNENVNLIQSQDVMSQNYDNFKSIIPLTSTQSQGHN